MTEQLYYFVCAVTAGVIVALVGYFLNLNATRRERRERAKEQLRGATRGILVEVETNLKLAKQPYEGIVAPFPVSIWEAHQGEILRLPTDLQDALYQVYVEIQMANAIVQADLHKRGYEAVKISEFGTSDEYKMRRSKVAEKAKMAIKLLRGWLEQES